MSDCAHCGSELDGLDCSTCGERAPAPRPPVRLRRSRWGVGSILLGLLLFSGGLLTGIWFAQPISSMPTAALIDPTLAGLDPLTRAERYLEEGAALLGNGKRSAAISQFRKALKDWEAAIQAEPENHYARTYQGLTYYYAGDTKRAVQVLTAVLDEDPQYLWALFNLAWIDEQGGKKSEALQLYQRYLAAAESEQEDKVKYAEQYELIPVQVEAAQAAVEKLGGGGR